MEVFMQNYTNLTADNIKKIFAEKRVITIDKLSEIFNCLNSSVRTFLKKMGAISSFNKNAKYYSLPEIIEFDENGIWKFKGVCFSKHKTLKLTILSIIENSPLGLSAKEVGKILHFPPHTMLSRLEKIKIIKREKISGHFVYFSTEEEKYVQQHTLHLKKNEPECSEFAQIFILIERIKNPDISINQIVLNFKKKQIVITNSEIQFFYVKNNITTGQATFSMIILLKKLLDAANDITFLPALFEKKPIVIFDAGKEVTTCCGAIVKPSKTRTKTAYTMHIGEFTAYEKLVKCDICGKEYFSQELLEIIPSGGWFGYDVITYIGESMYLNNRQAIEIQQDLRKKNIEVSTTHITYLAQKFIICFSLVHYNSSGKIIEFMNSNGGYILHLDALGGRGGLRIISAIDSLSDFVLHNGKIPSENSDSIIEFLNIIKAKFGVPLLVVQDMGKGIMKAVQNVFKNTDILICHFHFLRDIGKDLLGENYEIIRNRLRHFSIRTKLRNLSKEIKLIVDENPEKIDIYYEAIKTGKNEINLENTSEVILNLYTLFEWILDWNSDSNGYGFPFDRPHLDLSLRIKNAMRVVVAMVDINNNEKIILKIYHRLKIILEEIENDVALQDAIKAINEEIRIFDNLREAMRIASKDGKYGLNDEGDAVDIKTIKASVDELTAGLAKNPTFSTSRKWKSFLKQIQKYRTQLFADPITVQTIDGIKTIQPQRTNNIMEQMFRDFTRANKRKTGIDNIRQTINSMIKDTPLIRNLKNEHYRKIIIGDKKTLTEVIAEIDIEMVRKKMAEHKVYNQKIPQKIKILLRENKLIETMSKVVK